MKLMFGNICGKSQIGIGAFCAARSRPVSGDRLSTQGDNLMGNNSPLLNLNRKINFIGLLNKQRILMREY